MGGQKTVIFDFDGTLANTIDLVVKLYNGYADDFGYQKVEPKEFPSLRRLGYKKAMKLKGVRYSYIPKLLLRARRDMREHMDEVQPFDGIVAMLEELQREGLSIGVLTSNSSSLVKEFFDRHQFPAFDFIVSEKTYFGKEKAIKRIMKRFGLQQAQALYVGDEPRDVTASNKAGITVIGVAWGLGGEEGFEKAKPDVLVHTPAELLAEIQRFSQE